MMCSRSVDFDRRIRKHNKSRGGCYRCKAKRIKCCESKPRCTPCQRTASQCVYPDTSSAAASVHINILQENPLAFGLRDLRFFHDFMTASYPHLPLESEEAWRCDIPIIAQQHDFLMHAILALGAAHLHSSTNLDLQQSVDRHRAMALHGLTHHTSAGDWRLESEDDHHSTRLGALLATCYALTFTASYMSDSLDLFLVLVRACSSLTGEIVRHGHSSPLLGKEDVSPTTAALHLDVMRRRFNDPPVLQASDVDAAGLSLDEVEQHCTFEPFQWTMLQTMKSVIANIDQPFPAYCKFIDVWNLVSNMPHEDFNKFVDHSNVTSVLLQAHFLALEALLQPWLAWQQPSGRQEVIRKDALGALPPSAALRAVPVGISRWPWEFLKRRDEGLRK